jgi:hypothetical protein
MHRAIWCHGHFETLVVVHVRTLKLPPAQKSTSQAYPRISSTALEACTWHILCVVSCSFRSDEDSIRDILWDGVGVCLEFRVHFTHSIVELKEHIQ